MKKKSYSVVSSLRMLTILLFMMMLLSLSYCIISLIQIRERNYNTAVYNLKRTALQQKSRLDAIERFEEWAVINEPDIAALSSDSRIGEHLLPLRNLRNLIKERYSSLGENTLFLLYLNEGENIYNISPIKTSYSEYTEITNKLRSQLRSGSNKLIWRNFNNNNKEYLNFQVNYKAASISAIVNIEEFANDYSSALTNIPFSIEISDLSKNIIYKSDSSLSGPFIQSLILSSDNSGLPFNVTLYSNFFDAYGNQLIIQLVLISLFLMVAAFSCFFLSRLYTRIIHPIEDFHDNLSMINDNSDTILKRQDIKELEQTSSQFRALFSEINKLKINMYEQELEQARSELEILQHQIKPHFYLNCLSTISSMIQVNETELAEKMIHFTSIYLRYLFQSENKYAKLENELEHIDAYLNIQSLRLFTPIDYKCNVNADCSEALVPPLLFITFVENSVKHGVSPDKALSISLNISKIEGDTHDSLKFDLYDTGPGFSDEALKLLADDNIPSLPERHIGIKNSIRRLTLIYQNNFNIKFSNEEGMGAHVELIIPFEKMV